MTIWSQEVGRERRWERRPKLWSTEQVSARGSNRWKIPAAYVSEANIQTQIIGHANTLESDWYGRDRLWCLGIDDSPSDGSIAEISAVDEGEAVDDAAGDDQSSVNTMGDLSLLLVRIDWIIVDGQTGGIRGRLFIESMPAVDARIANLLVGLRMHNGIGAVNVPHSRDWDRLVYIRLFDKVVANLG